jgi:D-amino peptidase
LIPKVLRNQLADDNENSFQKHTRRDHMKIYVLCDLEGTAGVADQIHQCSFIHDEYDDKEYIPGKYGTFCSQARKLVTLELNALVEGALEAGSTDIWAWDGHCRFPGGLDVELTHPECKLVMNAGDGGPVGQDSSFDAFLMLGAHAKKGTPAASQAHMVFPGLEWNGEPVGEIGMNAAHAAVLGVPLVFISGDRAAVHEAQMLVPNIEAVITKEPLLSHAPGGFDRMPVLSLAPAKSRELIRATVRRAIERRGEISLPPQPPFNPLAN